MHAMHGLHASSPGGSYPLAVRATTCGQGWAPQCSPENCNCLLSHDSVWPAILGAHAPHLASWLAQGSLHNALAAAEAIGVSRLPSSPTVHWHEHGYIDAQRVSKPAPGHHFAPDFNEQPRL